jgi:hypothetical protein
VRAEAAVPGFHVQTRELSLIEVDKRDVIAAFQINIMSVSMLSSTMTSSP